MLKNWREWFLNLPVRRKLTVMVMGITFTSVSLTCAAFISYDIYFTRQSLVNELVLVGDIIGKRTAPGLQFPSLGDEFKEKATQNLQDLQSKDSIVLACLYKTDGTILARYAHGDDLPCPSPPPPLGDNLTRKLLSTHQEIHAINGQLVGSILLEADMRDVNQHLWQFSEGILILMAGVLSVAFLLTHKIQRVISTPVRMLTNTAQKITSYGDYSTRAKHFYGDELGILVDSFNRMLEEIQQRDTKLKRINENLEDMVKQRTEELEKAMRELEKALLAKSNFLSNMSHEIRTPNHAVMNCSKYVEFDLQAAIEKLQSFGQAKRVIEVVEGLKEVLDVLNDCLDSTTRIRQASNYQGYLLNNILDLSKLGENKMEFDMQYNNLSEIVENTVSENEGVFKGQKDLKIIFTEPAIDTKAEFDRGRITQVVNNLLGNAIKYSKQGTITITLDKATFKGKNNRKVTGIAFRIADQGIGIDPNELESIFEKFTESSRTKNQSGGTGIGLAICKEIIDAHKGRIWAENSKEGGSVFTFAIPFKQPKVRKAKKVKETQE